MYLTPHESPGKEFRPRKYPTESASAKIEKRVMIRNISVGIVGGGIGGAAAAVALRSVGIDATVYERASELREVGAGMMLWPNATRVLRELGLLEVAAKNSGSSRYFLVRSTSGEILSNIALGDFDVPALCIRRCDLLAALLSALPENSLRLGYDFKAYRQEESLVRIHFAGGLSAVHDVMIGADGIRSRVRAQLQNAQEPIYRGYTVWRGVTALPGTVPPDWNSETWGRGKRFGILHTGGNIFTWYATANVPSGHVEAPGARKNELMRMFAGWHQPVEQLIEGTEESEILKHGAYDLARLTRWGRGNVTLLGDSAHPCTPNLGLGGCMALEDALVLAKSFTKEATPELALRRYESLRRQRTRHVQHRSLLMGAIGQWENRFIVSARHNITRLLPECLFERNLRRLYSYAT
jgi:2-polyprenyl-6-methoxyphenol hydroxylase-like FAD-dependent oxidoreductase